MSRDLYPQYGLLGVCQLTYNVNNSSIDNSLSKEHDLIYTNMNAPWFPFICGSQGGGKSLTPAWKTVRFHNRWQACFQARWPALSSTMTNSRAIRALNFVKQLICTHQQSVFLIWSHQATSGRCRDCTRICVDFLLVRQDRKSSLCTYKNIT